MERNINYISKLRDILNQFMLNVLMTLLFPLPCKNYLKYLILKKEYNYRKRIQLMAENTNPRAIEFYRKHKFNEQEIHLFLKYLI